jgi:methylase of polypeptide subunit release factors
MSGNTCVALQRLGEALQQRGYHHTTATPATHARVNARGANQWATDLTGVFGWSRPFRAEAIPASIFDLMQQAGAAIACQGGWRSTLRASTLGGNLYFHSAWPTDASDAVFFGPDTYRYVAAMTQHIRLNQPAVQRAVDIGCGAGPGAIELALELPGAKMVAVDINDAALRLTRVNALLADAPIRVEKSNLLAGVEGNFDLIIANPPYMLDPAARAYRHGGGLLGAGLSLDIIDTALHRLNPGGTLLLYTGSAIVGGTDLFLPAAQQLLQNKCSWSYREIDPDVFGEELASDAYGDTDRIAAVFLTATIPD